MTGQLSDSPVRVTWVAQEAPDPAGGGGNRRSAFLLAGLRRSGIVTALTVGASRDALADEFASEPLTLRATPGLSLPKWRRRFATTAHALANRDPLEVQQLHRDVDRIRSAIEATRPFDIVVLEGVALARALPAFRHEPWCLDAFHLPSRVADQESRLATRRRDRWLVTQELKKARHLESWIGRSYDRVFVCSSEDGECIQGSPHVIPNGVDLSAIQALAPSTSRTVLLAASLDYRPNVDAAEWFGANVWPLILAQEPAADLVIAGRNPAQRVLDLAGLPRTAVVPNVPDMGLYVQMARVCIVPLRVGSGTRIKALECMAAARPVVGTTIGLEGLSIVDGRHAIVADQPQKMAAGICRILRDDEFAARLAAHGRSLVEERFDWRVIGDRYAADVHGCARLGRNGKAERC